MPPFEGEERAGYFGVSGELGGPKLMNLLSENCSPGTCARILLQRSAAEFPKPTTSARAERQVLSVSDLRDRNPQQVLRVLRQS